MAYIKIRLLSDLCAASGESGGNSIDSEIVVSTCGIPYIPARRIKGCLRNSAEMLIRMGYAELNPGKITELFGDEYGNEGSFAIEDAHIPGSGYLEEFLANSDSEDLPAIIRQHMKTRNVENIFSSVRGRTRMRNGISVDNSLRFVRVLNQYNPLTSYKEEMVFCAPVCLEDSSEKTVSAFKDICRATRHIGLNRNRGLGNVSMEYVEDDNKAELPDIDISGVNDSGRVIFTYRVTNESPLAIYNADENSTCIPAGNIIGCVVGEYLKNAEADTEEFRDLFLNGTTIWSSLNPVIDGEISEPAPLMLMKLKNDNNRYINIFAMDKGEWDTAKSLKPKTMDDSYASVTEKFGKKTYKIGKPLSHNVYHNNIVDRELYMQISVDSGYVFGGSVETDSKYAGIIKKLLQNTVIRVGRSKNAQYSSCSLYGKVEVSQVKSGDVNVKAGEKLYVILESDMVVDKNGVFEIEAGTVKREIAEKLGISDYAVTGECEDICRYGMLSGYQTSWHLMKPRIPCVKGGSVFSFTVLKDTLVPRRFFAGRYLQEGKGCCRVITEAEMKSYGTVEKSYVGRKVTAGSENILDSFKGVIIADAALETVRKYAREYSERYLKERKFKMDVPTGRLRLMLSEAKDIDDLRQLVSSIKESDASSEKETTRRAVCENIIKDIYGTGNIDWQKMLSSESGLFALAEKNSVAKAILNEKWKLPLEQVIHTFHYSKGGRNRT